ncbi:alpha/beta hydrolase [[Pseudomonas] boreopolis]|uniref:Dienelactone hydrolase n=2 Tax=Acidovorax delafieldii TaxID=47920 RepID=C5T3B7_ACIDE|nr:dienelactone hydrolase [Acidovorax delafieldii 2AN]
MDRDQPETGRRAFLGGSLVAVTGAAVAGAGLLAGTNASAQTTSVKGTEPMKQPAVVGYTNIKGILIERASYPARTLGTRIAAIVFKPAGFDPGKKYPAIVVTHPFGGVKEQTAGLYAARLAEQGFVTLAFDKSYQGESGGEPRLMEVPGQHIDDISSSIDYLIQQPGVDADNIGSLGVCAGGSYALGNAPTEMRVKAVATVSLFDLGDARRQAMGTLSYEARMQRLKEIAVQRSKEVQGAPLQMALAVPASNADFTDKTPALYREGYEYYRTPRGQHPNSTGNYVFTSLAQQMAFFPFAQVETISPRPILLIVGGNADTKFWSDGVLAKAQNPKELFIVPGATHVDMYDKPQYVGPAVEKLTGFFRQHLGDTRAA